LHLSTPNVVNYGTIKYTKLILDYIYLKINTLTKKTLFCTYKTKIMPVFVKIDNKKVA